MHGGDDGVGLLVAQRGQVVVLDEHEVEEANAVVRAAAAVHSVFLEAPPAGRGLAGVEDFGLCAFHLLDELRGERGDAGETLHEVQRHTFRGEDGASRAVDTQQGLPAVAGISIPRVRGNDEFMVQLAECGHGEGQPCEHQRLARDQLGTHRRGLGNGGERGHIARPDVLGERGADGALDFIGGQFHV